MNLDEEDFSDVSVENMGNDKDDREWIDVDGVKIKPELYRKLQTSEIRRRLLIGLSNDVFAVDTIYSMFNQNGFDVTDGTIRNYLSDMSRESDGKLVARYGDRKQKALWYTTDKGETVINYLREKYKNGKGWEYDIDG